MIDAVLSYHLNPLTCGVAKFNHELARRLKVACERFGSYDSILCEAPLVSVKGSELPANELVAVPWTSFTMLLHDWSDTATAYYLTKRARHVFAANPVIAERVRHLRYRGMGVTEAFCPATVNGNASRGKYRVLTFGMAHKLVLSHFEQLKDELEREHPDYTMELSTAVHEGSPWDAALTDSTDAMRAIFGDKLRVLGFLADDALAKELQEVDAVAAYYTPALRANNTTAWAALEAGKKLYTNTDADSPALDVTAHSWDKLVELLRA